MIAAEYTFTVVVDFADGREVLATSVSSASRVRDAIDEAKAKFPDAKGARVFRRPMDSLGAKELVAEEHW